jgi:hypothetical protein
MNVIPEGRLMGRSPWMDFVILLFSAAETRIKMDSGFRVRFAHAAAE